jgi:hypothetical protein
MWMLLDPSARKPIASKPSPEVTRGDTGVRERVPKARVASAKSSLLEYLGAASAAPQPNGAAAAVAIFLHPGRAPVGRVGIERVFDQFDCLHPKVHATLDEAEACHEGDVGFLLEVTRPFTDPHGDRHPCGVLFARSVRD